MKIIFLLLVFIIPIISIGQLDFEAIVGTSLNMSLKQEFRSIPNGPIMTTPTHFPGGGFDVGLGLRFRISKNFAISGAVEYQYKGYEANFTREPKKPNNYKYSYHILVFPFDVCYTFKNNIGLHLGVELASILAPRQQYRFHGYQEKALVAGTFGLSYTKKRFRFELFYKHYFTHYFRMTMYFNIGQNLPLVEVSHYTHFHDIQFRVCVRLFSMN
jgi:hypothetical protein